MPAIRLERLNQTHAPELFEAFGQSRGFHAPWVDSPATLGAVERYLAAPAESTLRFAVRTPERELAGVINVSAIVRGAFHSAYLGFYALAPHQGRGLMREGLRAVISCSFNEHELHRLEANVQPKNLRSAGLVRSLGFRLEGHSPRYLKIAGAWRDHDRYALTSEEWDPRARAFKPAG
jgi:ribosomal-protein-alanine N-acetyltransferase